MKYRPIFKRFIATIFILGILVSCNQYNTLPYSESAAPSVENLILNEIGNIKSENILIHSNGKSYQLADAIVEKNQVTGKLILSEEQAESNYSSSVVTGYDNNSESQEELYSHFYDTSNSLEAGDEIKISVDEATGKVNLYKKAGTIWKIIAGVLLVAGILFLGMVILVLIACNCPHAYVFDGQQYHYTNTLFTGAIAANLERDDFKILDDFQFDSDTYELIIKNEENEFHFINQLELVVVSHAENIEVASDQRGQIHSISNLQNASQIVNEKGIDLSKALSSRDDLAYSFDSESDESMVNAYAKFDRPADISNAKVVVKLKNSEWSGMVYKTFATMMGDRYENWVDKNHERSSEEAKAGMKEAGIPLVISIKKDNEWVDIETIDLVGEVSYNTLVATIDQSLITGDEIELRIQAGFKFWDLDYLGMDFTQDTGFETAIIQPSLNDNNAATLAALESDDALYLEHAQNGDSTYFKFEGLNTSTAKRTIIMHSKGYYLSNEEYAGTPSWAKLMKLKAPGGLSRLSKDIYDTYQYLIVEANTNE
ncbi:MAG: hypothetical protein GQ574_04020 [Crocinitomix sp.]|nr:hypothetical protein [Crocinitomix sp.]